MNDATSVTHQRWYRKYWSSVVIVVIAIALFVFLVLFRVEGCVLSSPGQVSRAAQALEIEGSPTYDSDGEVNLVTVRTIYGPPLMRLMFAWLDSSVEVRSTEQVLGGLTREDRIALGRLQMSQSADVAVAVALDRLGYDSIEPLGALVRSVTADGAADGLIRRGELIMNIDDEPVLTAVDLAVAVRSREPGSTVKLDVYPIDDEGVDDDTGLRTVNVTLGEQDGRGYLGVSVFTFVDIVTDLPVEVSLNESNIGGPSAGLAMTLAVLEELTPGDVVGGLNVVATGSITAEGWVLPVGGVAQKAHTALRAGADLMLVPYGQAEEALEVVGDYLEVIEVDTIDDALVKLAARGGDLSDLPEPPA